MAKITQKPFSFPYTQTKIMVSSTGISTLYRTVLLTGMAFITLDINPITQLPEKNTIIDLKQVHCGGNDVTLYAMFNDSDWLEFEQAAFQHVEILFGNVDMEAV